MAWCGLQNRLILGAAIGILAATSCSARVQPTATSTVPLMSAPGTARAPGTSLTDELEVAQTGFQEVSFEHWQGSESLIDNAYDWGVVINNPSPRSAIDVKLVASFKKDGAVVQTQTFKIDTVAPGEVAWGSQPLIINDASGAPAKIDTLDVTLSPSRWESTAAPTDQLLSPKEMPINDWKGELAIKPGVDHRLLIAMVAYFGPDHRLVAVDPSRIDGPEARASEHAPLSIAARPTGGPGPLVDVKVFLIRVSDTGQLLPMPPAVTATVLAEARGRWTSKGPPSYTWRMKRDCFCSGATVDITVASNSLASVTIVDPGSGGYSQEDAVLDALTITQLVDRIDDAIAGGDLVYASFDPKTGYPRSVTLTSRLSDGGNTYDTIDFIPSS